MSASFTLVTHFKDEPTPERFMPVLLKLSSIVPWRVGKPVYRFDPDLAAELMDCPDDNRIPANVLMRLPYPCVFIERPPGIDECEGLFVFLEADERYPDALELRMHYLFSDGTIEGRFFLYDLSGRDGSVFDARLAEEDRQGMSKPGYTPPVSSPESEERMKQICGHIHGHINMVLYLCADESDTQRTSPIPRRRGPRRDVASYSDVIDAGREQGAIIRRARQAAQSHASSVTVGIHKSPIPHVRRAHWHLYWVGAGRATPAIKWIMPVFVGGSEKPRPTTINIVKE